MKVGIIGGGAIGLLYAFQLSKAFPVTLYINRKEQLQLLETYGISISEEVAEREINFRLWNTKVRPTEDVIMVAVKQYALQVILPTLEECTKEQTVLFLQNGMSHLEFLGKINNPSILLGVVEHGVKKNNDHRINWTGKGRTKIACYDKPLHSYPREFIDHWVERLGDCFPVEICDDYHSMMTEKLLVNAVINPLTAIYHVRNGALLTNPYYKKTMKILYEEISFLIEEDSREEMWKHICTICERTAENWSSMERDITEGRQTEIESILGYIRKMANRKGKSVPVTEFIYQAVKGLQIHPK
jgi:2-dehydropantoate 2-reductase